MRERGGSFPKLFIYYAATCFILKQTAPTKDRNRSLPWPWHHLLRQPERDHNAALRSLLGWLHPEVPKWRKSNLRCWGMKLTLLVNYFHLDLQQPGLALTGKTCGAIQVSELDWSTRCRGRLSTFEPNGVGGIISWPWLLGVISSFFVDPKDAETYIIVQIRTNIKCCNVSKSCTH